MGDDKMDFIKWEDSYSVGVETIDLQHKILIKLLNDFEKEINTAGNDEIMSLIKALLNYGGYHFETEENYLIKHSDLDSHKSEHKLFVDKLLSLEQGLKNGKNVSEDMLGFLVSWLKNHILKTDKVFFEDIDDTEPT